jgi:hypothetical protein
LKGIGIMDDTDKISIDLLHQEFRIHYILGTTECYYIDLIALIRFCAHSINFKKLFSLQPSSRQLAVFTAEKEIN